jgi:hypothetical protein
MLTGVSDTEVVVKSIQFAPLAPSAVLPVQYSRLESATPALKSDRSIVPEESISFHEDFIVLVGPFTGVVAPSNPIKLGKSLISSFTS